MLHVDFKKCPCRMSHVSVAYFPQCHMSNLRNKHVACHYLFYLHVPYRLGSCRMSILRKAHVAVSNLRVEGHTFQRDSFCIDMIMIAIL